MIQKLLNISHQNRPCGENGVYILKTSGPFILQK